MAFPKEYVIRDVYLCAEKGKIRDNFTIITLKTKIIFIMGYITAFFILLAAFGFIELSIRIALVEFYIGHMNEIELKFLQSQLTALKIESEALKNESEA